MPRSLAQPGAPCLSAGVRAVIAGAAVVLAACGMSRGEEVPLEDVCLAAGPCADIGCYATFDTVFLQRSNWAVNQPLAVTGVGATATPVISAQDMQFATQPGVRLIAGEIDPCGIGWEVGYLGVWGMFADATAQDPANISVPDPLATLVPSLSNASVARTTYASTLNSAELNIFSHCFDGGYSRVAGEPWRRCSNYCGGSFDWLAGVRWASLDESAGIFLSPASRAETSSYTLRSSTNIVGPQVGARGRMNWDRWAFESWTKLCLGGSAMSQSQPPLYDAFASPGSPPVRGAQSSSEGGVGFIADMNFTAVYRLGDSWGLRMGYNLIWLSGVALAPNQFDFGAAPTSGRGLNGGSTVFLSGANLGLEKRW